MLFSQYEQPRSDVILEILIHRQSYPTLEFPESHHILILTLKFGSQSLIQLTLATNANSNVHEQRISNISQGSTL